MSSYRERVSWPVWFHVVFVLGAALCAFGAWRTHGRSTVGWLVLAGTAIALLVVWWRMRALVVEFGPEGAAFGFLRAGRRVPTEQIRSAEPEDYSAARYMGWGYRMGWKPRDRAYSLIGVPRGVRLEFDDERGRAWSIFLACRDPEAAVKALRK